MIFLSLSPPRHSVGPAISSSAVVPKPRHATLAACEVSLRAPDLTLTPCSSCTPPQVAICELPFDFVSKEGESGGAGGTCVIRGCVPKKLFHYGAQFHEAFADAPHFGWKGDGMQPPTDWATLLANKNTEIRRLNGIYSRLLGNAGVKELEGHAKITGPNSVSIGGRTLTAANILVATGSKASVPPGIEGTDLPGVINSDQALVLSERPKKVPLTPRSARSAKSPTAGHMPHAMREY